MMLAGFEVPTHGEIYLADRPIKNMPPHSATSAWSPELCPVSAPDDRGERRLPAVRSQINKAEAQERVRTALRMIKLENLAHRRRGSCPAASSSAWRWPAHWFSNPQLVLMTSPWAPWTSACGSKCN